MKTKVFCIGMFKTGTTSIGMALQQLGYKATYDCWGIPGLNYWYPTPENREPFKDDIYFKATMFDAFADAPWLFYFRELDFWFPGSKFILSLRSTPEALARSDMNMWKRHGGTPPPAEQFIERYQKHNAAVRDWFGTSPNYMEICVENSSNPWGEICSFLGHPIPDTPFPHANKGQP